MTDTTTGQQLYPASRSKGMATEVINKVIAFVTVDLNSTWVTYEGMTRDETVLTAQQSWCDLMNELHGRANAIEDERLTALAAKTVDPTGDLPAWAQTYQS